VPPIFLFDQLSFYMELRSRSAWGFRFVQGLRRLGPAARWLHAPLTAICVLALWLGSIASASAVTTIDMRFGSQGWALVAFDRHDVARVARTVRSSEGRWLTAVDCRERGTGRLSLCLSRMNADGTEDRTFNGKGTMERALGEVEFGGVDALIAQPDGRYSVGYRCRVDTAQRCLMGFLADGRIDSSFNGGAARAVDYAAGYAAMADGRIVYAWPCAVDTIERFCVRRLLANGANDPSFNAGAAVSVAFDETMGDFPSRVLVQTDGKLVVAGHCERIDDRTFVRDYCVARLNDNGSLDASFGVGGRSVTQVGIGGAAVLSIQQDAQGRLFAAGQCEISTGFFQDCAVRYRTNGALDIRFAQGGRLVAPSGSLNTLIGLDGDGAWTADNASCAALGSACLTRWQAALGALDSPWQPSQPVEIQVPSAPGSATARFAFAIRSLIREREGIYVMVGTCDAPRFGSGPEDRLCLTRVRVSAPSAMNVAMHDSR
jgi:uncharacterized delta-60 repeat protein